MENILYRYFEDIFGGINGGKDRNLREERIRSEKSKKVAKDKITELRQSP